MSRERFPGQAGTASSFLFAWDGSPRQEVQWWMLTNGPHTAICRMFSHECGHEVRLEQDGRLVLSKVCTGSEEPVDCQARWRLALQEEGWCELEEQAPSDGQ
jgi:hypothetical protein